MDPGSHVVVTGASSGIGRALARAFGREGATVWMGARRADKLAEAAREVDAAGGAGRPLPLDVTDEASVEAFAKTVSREAPGLAVLVNNAGVGGGGPLADTSPDEWRRVIDTNLTGPFLVTRALLPLLRKREGRRHVVNVASVAGRQGFPGGGAYCASKAGLRIWTESIAAELAEEGIRVTALLPGYVATPLVSARRAPDMIQPDELARYVVDLVKAPPSLHVDEIVLWPWKMYTE